MEKKNGGCGERLAMGMEFLSFFFWGGGGVLCK